MKLSICSPLLVALAASLGSTATTAFSVAAPPFAVRTLSPSSLAMSTEVPAEAPTEAAKVDAGGGDSAPTEGAAAAEQPPAPAAAAATTAATATATATATEGAAASGAAAADGSADIISGARQKMYGQSPGLDLPGTYVRCGRCKTAFALQSDDLGDRGKGRRVECSICSHSWYQARDRLFDLSDGFELIPFPPHDLERIEKNIAAGRDPDFMGTSKFYVGNLDFRCTEDDLRTVFAGKGNVGDVSIVTDQETGRSRGFAFVTMMTDEDGEKALELDGEEVNGRNISVRPPNN